MRPARPVLRTFSLRIWGALSASTQRKASALYAKCYESGWSRHLIGPYCRFNGLSEEYLSRFRPASGGKDYKNFQDFFIRKLRERPAPEKEPVWPCEGLLCESGRLEELPSVKVKGVEFTPRSVFGSFGEAIPPGHRFANIFLHNRDYHRVHSPIKGRIHRMEHLKGELLLLRPWVYPKHPSLPAFRNERVNLEMRDEEGESYFLSIVGGPAVGGIRMQIEEGERVEAVEELGTFLLGSTCCMAFPDRAPNASVGERVEMGEPVQ